MVQPEESLFGDAGDGEHYGRHSTGILPGHVLKRLIRARREVLATEDIEDKQIQPASLDLRLGAVAWRVRASFLPGPNATVEEKLHKIGGAKERTGQVIQMHDCSISHCHQPSSAATTLGF